MPRKQSKDPMDTVWKKYSQTRAEDLRAQLIEHYAETNMVRAIALNVCKGSPPHVWKIEDLISEGMIGLMRAVETFDPARKIKFSTYAPHRIRGAMIDFLRAEDPVPRLVRQKQKKLKLLEEAGESTAGAQEKAKLSQAEIEMLARKNRSLDRPLFHTDVNRPSTLHDQLPNGAETEGLRKARQSAHFERLTRGLLFEEKMVVWMYFHRQMTMVQIAEFFDLSESRISQMLSGLLRWIKKNRTAHEHFSELESA